MACSRSRSEEHTSELQSHRDLHSFPTRRSSDLVRGKFIQVESRMSQTGANADEWVPMKPGLDGVLALGLAHVIMKTGGRRPDAAGRAGTLIEGWAGEIGRASC